MTDKQVAAEVIGRLPETVSFAEITEELRLIAALQQGQADAAAGRVRPHAEVGQLFSSWVERWTTKSRASS